MDESSDNLMVIVFILVLLMLLLSPGLVLAYFYGEQAFAGYGLALWGVSVMFGRFLRWRESRHG